MLYVPYAGPTEPAKAGLPNFTRSSFPASDGVSIPYWEHNAEGPIVLYFHGNGGGLHAFVPALDWLGAQGLHVVAMEYRGFPGAPGVPGEKALVADAIALFDVIKARYPQRPIAIWGYSLGSGVAVQLAAARKPAALILEAPFSATVDRARQMFPLFPVSWLMHDQYRSRDYIGAVHAPVLILHGAKDSIIPIGLGEALYARASAPKTFKSYPDAGHLDLIATPAYQDALGFIREHAAP